MSAFRPVRWALLTFALTVSASHALTAQATGVSRDGRSRASGRDPSQRGPLERRLDDRINAIIRTRLQLTDEQFARLRAVARRVENERRTLRLEETATRNTLRRELLAGDSASDSTVAAMLERMPSLERRRIDLMEREQSELAKFLSPVQRAKYMGLQDELRRSMQDIQARRAQPPSEADSTGGPGRGVRRQLRPPVRR